MTRWNCGAEYLSSVYPLSMDIFAGIDSYLTLLFVLGIATFAGLVKGMVGFAMPTVLISGLTLVMPPEQALAALILPTLVTNGWQALRQGIGIAWQTIVTFKMFLICGAALMFVSAQLVRSLDVRLLFGLIGGPILLFALLQLAGWTPRLAKRSTPIEALVGAFAGFIGGLSGIWGPPTVAYLTAVDTPKQDHIRAQGVIYGLGALVLALAHLQTGVLRADTLPLTLALLPCALLGLWIGFQFQDRIAQATFRRLTLIVLALAGANLLRRAFIG